MTSPRLSPSAVIGAVMLGVFVLLGIIGPWIAPYSPEAINLDARFLSPSSDHWLGTDKDGLDILSLLLWGARNALVISSAVVGACATIGVAIGASAGTRGGVFDEIAMRAVDILLAFPGILLNIAIVAVVDRPSLLVVICALIINGWVSYARVARGQAMALSQRDYIVAARSLGASEARVTARHIIPNLLAPVMVQMTFGLGGVILIEAALSFLGLGPQVEHTWGKMLDQGTTFLWRAGYSHAALIPGLAIMWVVLAANLLGDGLRDYFDPRQRGRS